MRSKKAIQNIVASMCQEIVAIICGLVLPRLILTTFGSQYNGITSSITQFLSCVILLRSGVAAVTRAALYKPLADKDTYKISQIVNATSSFMKKVALLFLIVLIFFAGLYPFLISSEFEWLFSASLVLIMGISTFIQYYFGLPYQFLLEADQKQWVIQILQIVTTLLNTLLAVILMRLGYGIHAVKLGSAVAYSISPLFIYFYVGKKYKINKKVQPDNSVIKQRWDSFAQSVALFVQDNTDVMVLTVFSSLSEVSVYTVYNYVIANIKNILQTFVSGFGAAFGNMLAKGESELLEKNFRIYELIIYSLVSIIYTSAGILIVPFVRVYTLGVTDAEYIRPLFALVFIIAGAFRCIHIPYQTLVEAAGHFKQTRNGAIVEATMNILISILLVSRYGLIGVAVGTLISTFFRTIQYIHYFSCNIVKRKMSIAVKHILLCSFVAIITCIISDNCYVFEVGSYLSWVLKAILVCSTTFIVTLILDLIFYKEDVLGLFHKFRNALRKR